MAEVPPAGSWELAIRQQHDCLGAACLQDTYGPDAGCPGEKGVAATGSPGKPAIAYLNAQLKQAWACLTCALLAKSSAWTVSYVDYAGRLAKPWRKSFHLCHRTFPSAFRKQLSRPGGIGPMLSGGSTQRTIRRWSDIGNHPRFGKLICGAAECRPAFLRSAPCAAPTLRGASCSWYYENGDHHAAIF